VGIVGSRACSDLGEKRSLRLSFELAKEGVTVVSGLAEGVDGAAHRGALKGGGRTLAVLGTGLKHIYPYEHEELGRAVTQRGALVSQFDDPRFSGYRNGRNFLKRNAVIAAFSRVVVVVEAKKRSGSLSTVRAALAQGKPVGLLRSLVESERWAAELARSPEVFVVENTADILERVGF
jgi:DNA processing protein